MLMLCFTKNKIIQTHLSKSINTNWVFWCRVLVAILNTPTLSKPLRIFYKLLLRCCYCLVYYYRCSRCLLCVLGIIFCTHSTQAHNLKSGIEATTNPVANIHTQGVQTKTLSPEANTISDLIQPPLQTDIQATHPTDLATPATVIIDANIQKQRLVTQSQHPWFWMPGHQTQLLPTSSLGKIGTDVTLTDQTSLQALLQAEFAISRNDVPSALKIYKRQAFNKDATTVFERALSLSLQYEDTFSSLQFAHAWQQLNPDHIPAWFYVAHLALKAHDYQLAGATLGRILTYDPRADLSQILEGIYPESVEDQRALLVTLQQLNSEYNTKLSVLQAGLLLQFEQPKVALIHINRALKEQPNNAPYLILKADILKQMSTPETVLAFIAKHRKKQSDTDAQKSLYLYEIRYLIELGRMQAAWRLLLDTHQKFTDDNEVTLLAALVGLDNEAYKKADELLFSLLTYPAYVDKATYYLGVSHERQKDYSSAKYYYAQVMQEELVLESRRKVVAFELMADNLNGALNTLVQLRQQFDIYAPDSYIMQADILRRYDYMDAAKNLLLTASEEYPTNEAIIFARSQLLDDQEDDIIKHSLLTYLLNRQPENLTYQISYASFLINQPKQTAKNIKHSVEIATNIAKITYGDAQYDKDRHLQALTILAQHALNQKQYQQVIDYLQIPFDGDPDISSGILLLRAYQGLNNQAKVQELLQQLQQHFDFQHASDSTTHAATNLKVPTTETTKKDAESDKPNKVIPTDKLGESSQNLVTEH